jgi:serine/threonine protein kinase
MLAQRPHASRAPPLLSSATPQEHDTLVLVQEYAPGGDLLGLMAAHGGRVDEASVAQGVLRPLLAALLYLHRWGVVHRDVKVSKPRRSGEGQGGGTLRRAARHTVRRRRSGLTRGLPCGAS